MTFAEVRAKAMSAWEEFSGGEKLRILVGAGTCGMAAGAGEIMEAIGAHLEARSLEADVCEVGCLGLCYAEPLVELMKSGTPRVLYSGVAGQDVPELIDGYLSGDADSHPKALAIMDGPAVGAVPAFEDLDMLRGQVRIVSRNFGLIDPENIDHYIARDGYAGLVRAVGMTPEEVIDEIKESGLRGRGGAGFPTGMKWDFCRRAEGDEKYMIVNADEGDPGAFMDRDVIESDPHTVLEGMAIAAYAIGASHGYIYVRAEYPLAIRRLEKAIADAKALGLMGDNILGSPFSFHVIIKMGAGAFVCGEETSLLASIEGKRGMPRSRPPFPAQKGLFGKPTNINNVETLANVPVIMTRGSRWFAGFGTEKSRGTKTFALAGKVVRTGLIEVPLGIKLTEVVNDIGGGVPDGKAFKAVQTGGPSGGCLPSSMLESAVDYETLAQAGSIMGSGGMVVMDEETCMVDVARYFIDFTRSESCGKCAPCRLGTQQMSRVLDRIVAGMGKPDDVELLEELGSAIKQGSLCGLGQTAPNPVLTTIRYFRDEYDAHIKERRCPSGACQALKAYTIDTDKCICCGKCAKECPADCITGKAGRAPSKATQEDIDKGRAGEPFVIDAGACVKCGNCVRVCPVGAAKLA